MLNSFFLTAFVIVSVGVVVFFLQLTLIVFHVKLLLLFLGLFCSSCWWCYCCCRLLLFLLLLLLFILQLQPGQKWCSLGTLKKSIKLKSMNNKHQSKCYFFSNTWFLSVKKSVLKQRQTDHITAIDKKRDMQTDKKITYRQTRFSCFSSNVTKTCLTARM